MTQGPKLPSRQPVPRLRDNAPRYQRLDADGVTGHPALLGFVRLLARQAAREVFVDGNGSTTAAGGSLTLPEQ